MNAAAYLREIVALSAYTPIVSSKFWPIERILMKFSISGHKARDQHCSLDSADLFTLLLCGTWSAVEFVYNFADVKVSNFSTARKYPIIWWVFSCRSHFSFPSLWIKRMADVTAWNLAGWKVRQTLRHNVFFEVSLYSPTGVVDVRKIWHSSNNGFCKVKHLYECLKEIIPLRICERKTGISFKLRKTYRDMAKWNNAEVGGSSWG